MAASMQPAVNQPSMAASLQPAVNQPSMAASMQPVNGSFSAVCCKPTVNGSFYKTGFSFDRMPARCAKPKHAYTVHVLAGISYRGRTNLCIFTGIMDSVIYQKILEDNLLAFVQEKFPEGFRLYQDNDSKHYSKTTRAWMVEHGVLDSVMVTPASSPDVTLAYRYRDGESSLELFPGDADLPPGKCSYLGQCNRTVTYTGLFGFPRERTIDFTCRKEADCETRFFSWSVCTRPCGTGYRRRIGRCDGPLCDRWLREVEQCNTQGCVTVWPPGTAPPGTTPPPPPGTTPPPPPPTTPPPPPTTTPPAPALPSCIGQAIGQLYPDPNMECSNTYYACTGSDTPMAFSCPPGLFFTEGTCDFAC